MTEPSSVTHTVLNYIGGDPWTHAGEWIQWDFEVPEDGYYNISIKARQMYQRGALSARTVYIDGEVPFEDLEAVTFGYNTSWEMRTLGDREGKPFRFYLTKGSHTIRMEVTLGEMGPVLNAVEDSIYRLNQIYRKLLVLTGVNPDRFRDYNLASVYPEAIEAMDLESKRLYKIVDDIVATTGQKSDRAAVAQTLAVQLEQFVQSNERITESFTNFKDNITSLGTAMQNMSESKLDVDLIMITGEDAGLSIQSGIFNTDVSKYVVEGHVCLPYYGEYNVLSLATEFSDAFTLTDKNGVLKIARYEPQTEQDVIFLIDMLNNTYAYTPDGEQLYAFFAETYDTQAHTIYVSRTDSYGGLLETHLITLDFVYDAEIKEKIDALVETLPKGEYIEEEDWTLPYYYTVNDLELINYWLTCTEENDEYNVNNLINYSKELKEYIGYRNFRLDARMGGGDYFVTETAGIADFKYNGTVYASIDMGSRAEHVIYVPDDTTDLLAAARNRIDSYLGEGKVTLKSEGPVIEVLWYDWYVNSQWEWGETDPDMTYEEWKESEFAPTISAADITGLEWLTDDTECFSTTINGYDYLLLAVKDSAKITDVPTYQNVDFSTEVTVLTDDPSVPLDTMIEVETLTEGEEYDHIMENLTVEEHETYDIKLYSGTKLDYVTELESGEFEVQIPVSEQLAGKELIAYYVDAEGTVAEHEVTVEEGVASFATDHFSAYTLAVKKSTAPCEHAFAWDEESKNYLCSACGAAYEQTLDIDGDGSPTTADAIMLLRAIDGGIELPLYLTDINRDGKLRIFDAIRFLQLMNA